MALIDDVKRVCDRLAPRGWQGLLQDVTGGAFDLSQGTSAQLAAALVQPLPASDRNRAGFDDFHNAGARAITGGSPARSLLYHALASPQVHPTLDGQPSADPDDYPTLDELEHVENYIFSLVADRTDLADTFVAVFAYQYRPASRSPHRRHADVAYSRTGVARVGTAAANYDPSRRSFWVGPQDGSDALAVLPARYGAFLARRTKPGAAGSVQGGHLGLRDDDYVFPVHKLFDGDECLDQRSLSLSFGEFHRNEKLRKTHSLSVAEAGLPVPPGFDINASPYVRDSQNGGNLATLEDVGSTRLVVPVPASALTRTVTQRNTITNTDQIVHFVVPRLRNVPRVGNPNRRNRFVSSTLEIPAYDSTPSSGPDDRLAPEYVNIRHAVDPAGPPTQPLNDLNLLAEPDYSEVMAEGGYAAAHFTDDSCDGCIEVIVEGLDPQTENLPAFSLITAPDFFPLADQSEVEADPSIRRVEPLSKGRLPVNPTLPRRSQPSVPSFDHSDTTVTAIVGAFASGPTVPVGGQPNRMVSFLPDGASNVFAPGWDTSRSRDARGSYLTSSGLGSPFPEDVKLCAAISSFWPAVAPDNARTFGNEGWANQLPMLDEELGFHPNHERVQSGEVTSYRGWDGEYGPFIERIGSRSFVNYVSIQRSDYVKQSLAGRIRVSLTADVQSEELIARNNALELCNQVLATPTEPIRCLVEFRKVDDWQTFGGRPEVLGGGFLFLFAELPARGSGVGDPERRPTDELDRVRRLIRKRHICQVGTNGVAYRNGRDAFVFVPFSDPTPPMG